MINYIIPASKTTEKVFCTDCGIAIGWDFRYDIPLGCEWKDGWRCVKCHTRKFKPPIKPIMARLRNE